jgi:hypothetical protein
VNKRGLSLTPILPLVTLSAQAHYRTPKRQKSRITTANHEGRAHNRCPSYTSTQQKQQHSFITFAMRVCAFFRLFPPPPIPCVTRLLPSAPLFSPASAVVSSLASSVYRSGFAYSASPPAPRTPPSLAMPDSPCPRRHITFIRMRSFPGDSRPCSSARK